MQYSHKYDRCIRCLCCREICPEGAISVQNLLLGKLMFRHKVEVSDLIVIYDDLDLPLGKLRIRQGGSSGGHKGMGSIIASIGSKDFCRIKVGSGVLLLLMAA